MSKQQLIDVYHVEWGFGDDNLSFFDVFSFGSMAEAKHHCENSVHPAKSDWVGSDLLSISSWWDEEDKTWNSVKIHRTCFKYRPVEPQSVEEF